MYSSAIHEKSVHLLNPVPDDKILDWSKLKHILDTSSGLKKTRAAHSFFQHLTMRPRAIFSISKITS